MKINNRVCNKMMMGGKRLKKKIDQYLKLLPCNNCDGDYFYNLQWRGCLNES
jgi:hypothetical protein